MRRIFAADAALLRATSRAFDRKFSRACFGCPIEYSDPLLHASADVMISTGRSKLFQNQGNMCQCTGRSTLCHRALANALAKL